MLKNTFQHIEGFGSIKELNFWKSGIVSWEEFIRRNSYQLDMFDNGKAKSILESSLTAFEKGDADFFAKTLSASEYYRIALTFPEDVIFFDIETTGLSRYYDHITLIGWSFLGEFNVYYKGLGKEKLVTAFKRAKCIVTFNGSLFDLPFIRNEFPELKIPVCHIDLRFFARRFGFSGGLKEIEKKIGFKRFGDAKKLSGEFAPILWHKYKEGDLKSLEKLIEYNRFDIDGMKLLLDICIEKSIEGLPFLKKMISPIKFSKYPSELKFSKKSNKGFVFIKKYEEHVGTTVTLKDLPVYENLSIVGIDLTGSEKRATGWCHLLYNKAITKRINSDSDLIDETLRCKPTVVSIDSPLSLPKGRKSVFDDDEGRDEFGIMRECERILKRRGVSVYPSLIPSMQRLTQRGILLAQEFRKRGVPVIESYPGAAQDILGIPRKRASLEYLMKGLSSFGIQGDYEDIEVSHDELDAITSAMLGYFFWCGKFEALGNEEEDFLIIPDVKKNFPDWENKIVIGFSGGLATGKTTSGQYLSSKGFTYGRFSMLIEKLVTDEGNESNRKNLQEMGDYVNKIKGQRWLCKNLILQLFQDKKKIVIDGLRFPEDHAFMKEKFGGNFIHIHLKCDDTIRKQRYMKEERNDVKFENAIKHTVEREVDNLLNLADIVINNNRKLSYLYNQLNKLIK
jgi:uncharacterized protein YprB with RNaseH-like and TPR domain/predicted nuclease with RNAse H fold/dephospho-CoA kinase